MPARGKRANEKAVGGNVYAITKGEKGKHQTWGKMLPYTNVGRRKGRG